MKYMMLFVVLAVATKLNMENEKEVFEQNKNGPILVKIEEDEYTKVKRHKSSNYIGVSYNYTKNKWQANRRSKNEKKTIHNGYYINEKTAAHASDTFARKLMTNGEQNHRLNFPDDDTEVYPEKKNTFNYIGVSYKNSKVKWQVQRWSKSEKKMIHNGCYNDEETAVHASDTLARKLMANGEKNHKLNFPDDETEVYAEMTASSKLIGVSYDDKISKWRAQRYSKKAKKLIRGGSYNDEKTAAYASDTLAKQFMENGEQNHKLNFPDSDTEVRAEKTNTSKYIGVFYNNKISKWRASRYSKNEKKIMYIGDYKDEDIAAHASDTLARKLIANDKQKLKLNFPDDETEVRPKPRNTKRKRPNTLNVAQNDKNVDKN